MDTKEENWSGMGNMLPVPAGGDQSNPKTFVVGASLYFTLHSSQIGYFNFYFVCKCNFEGCGAFIVE